MFDTFDILSICPKAKKPWLDSYTSLHDLFIKHHPLPQYHLHFMAQVLHETGGLSRFVELIGSYDAAKRDGSRSLQNTMLGDGYRYRGRGPIQLTGRGNFKWIGDKLGLDLVNNPERITDDPDIGWLVSITWWDAMNMNKKIDKIDRSDVRSVTRIVNGGYNGLNERVKYYNKLMQFKQTGY